MLFRSATRSVRTDPVNAQQLPGHPYQKPYSCGIANKEIVRGGGRDRGEELERTGESTVIARADTRFGVFKLTKEPAGRNLNPDNAIRKE